MLTADRQSEVNQQWFIGAKAPNKLCKGKGAWHSQQVLLPPTALLG